MSPPPAPINPDDELYKLLYAELKRLARLLRLRERPDHTLNSTALVNEAYLKLAAASKMRYADHNHFLAVAARVMRQVLVDYARAKLAARRGAGALKVDIDALPLMAHERPEKFLELDAALDRLAQLDDRQASMVDMKYFGGMTEEEIADKLGLGVRTVFRHLGSARTWLYGEIGPLS